MENSISKNWYMILIKGIIMILLAILLFMSPEGALLTYAIFIGIGFIVAGIIRIFQGFSARGSDNWGWIIFEGALDLIVGFILVAHPGLTAATLPFILGLWATFYGIFLFVNGFSGDGDGFMKIIGGILIFILGMVIMFNPIILGMTLVVWIGIILLIVGIYNVIIAFSVK